MRPPLDLHGFTSEVVYPASIFSLKRHENMPYERFAFNVFGEAINKLDEHLLPKTLAVEFSPSSPERPAWAINCSVRSEEVTRSNPKRIVIQSPELLPTFLLMFSVCIGKKLFSNEGRKFYLQTPKSLSDDIQRFFDSASAVVQAYHSKGHASAIRAGYEFLKIEFDVFSDAMDHFDTLSYLIVNHEVAHIHVGQFSTTAHNSVETSKAFEIITDLVATEWLFRRYVCLTPDTEAYRKRRNLGSHKDAIWANAKWAIDSQLSLLLLMGVAKAQSSGGRFNFDGGLRHPGSFGRYWLQQAWLAGAIEGQFRDLLGNELHQELLKIWEEYFSIICEAGLVSRKSMQQVVDEDDVRIITRAANIAEANNIEDLSLGIHFLRSRAEAAKKVKTKMVPTED